MDDAPTRRLTRARIPVPLPSPWFWGLVVLYVLLGLVGHDPWKGDDAIGFGIAWSMAQDGDWLRPAVAGRMVAEEGPLAFWVAAIAIKSLGGILQAHDAARLAAGAWMAWAVFALHRASRSLDGAAAGRIAVLALLACLGLLLRSHETSAEPAFLAGWCTVLAGLALGAAGGCIPRMVWLAAGVAICLLARGAAASLPVLLVVLAWSVVGRREANRLGIMTCLGALAAGILPYAAWLVAAGENAAFGAAHATWERSQLGIAGLEAWRYYGKTLAWFTFPAWLLGVWWLVKRRPPRLLDVDPVPAARRLPLLAIACMLAWLAVSPRPGESVLLPLLPPLALLIAPGQVFLSRGQAALTDWFCRTSVLLAGFLVWLGYVAMVSGWPPRIAANLARLEPGFVAPSPGPALWIALIATIACCVAIARSARTPLRGIVHWCYGVTLIWLLVTTLWLPWIDYGRSYRSVAHSLRAAMPGDLRAKGECVRALNLGLAERASFGYFGQLRFGADGQACPWILAQGSRQAAPPLPPGARLAWEGHRPGDRDELFRLFRSLR